MNEEIKQLIQGLDLGDLENELVLRIGSESDIDTVKQIIEKFLDDVSLRLEEESDQADKDAEAEEAEAKREFDEGVATLLGENKPSPGDVQVKSEAQKLEDIRASLK